jgi:hypothetical protein
MLGMNTNELIEALDAEIARLEQARAILDGNRLGNGRSAAAKRGRPAKATSFDHGANVIQAKAGKRRTISAEGRGRIASAQKARWAKTKRK